MIIVLLIEKAIYRTNGGYSHEFSDFFEAGYLGGRDSHVSVCQALCVQKDLPVSEEKQVYIDYVRSHLAVENFFYWDLWALDGAWSEYERKEHAGRSKQ